MRKFGIRMEGCEERIEQLVREQMKHEPVYLTYLEIGVAGGETLRSVTEIVREAADGKKGWITIGVDLPPGEAWALNLEGVKGAMPDLVVHTEGLPRYLEFGRPHLVLRDAHTLLAEGGWLDGLEDELCLDVVLIDGCHGKACVIRDFLGVAPRTLPGSLVIFHDAGEADQGGDYQPHCREGINVRAALRELGLLEGTRPGWEFVEEIPGDKSRGGNSCVVVRKRG